MIRDDIALARVVSSTSTLPGQLAAPDPIGDAPPGITYTVETPHDAGIVVTINGVPPDWGWVSVGGCEAISPALRALADELAELMDGYSHDGANVGRRFFGRVRVGGEVLVWWGELVREYLLRFVAGLRAFVSATCRFSKFRVGKRP